MSDPASAGVCRPLAESKNSFTFTFDGRTIQAIQGQSIAAALYAAGVRVFTRSFKYHRPRGLFCVSGDCPNCLMNVDGRPNVRTCIESARNGQVVTHQNAWPSLDFDVLRAFDKLDRFLPVGFYYKRFYKPRWLWLIFEHVVRHVAGLGRIDAGASGHAEAAVEHLHADVCIIGAGPAGLAAAAAAKAAGASVVLLERAPFVGGHLTSEGTHPDLLSELAASVGRTARVATTVFGLYEGNLIGASQNGRLLKVRAKQIVVCTGGRQQPFVFHHNDLPGIFLGRGVLRLARLDGVLAGRRAVVLTDCDDGHALAGKLTALGIDVRAVIDQRPSCPQNGTWPALASSTVVAASGRHHLKAIRVRRRSEDGAGENTISCDLLCLASSLVPANELLLMAGWRYRRDKNGWRPDRSVPGILAAGAVAGTLDVQAQIREGKQCGRQAAAFAAGQAVPPRQLDRPPAGRLISPSPEPMTGGKQFVCFCEDVTVKDIEQAVAEGFDHVETLKRYTTANMGPCQGKMCGLAAAELCARLTGRDPNSIGQTTSRPPVVPVEMAILAADRRHHPIRRTPLHHWHQQSNARWMDAGQWKRPESYGDPVAEVRTVRNAVGLIDVSTLGKIEVIGPDAAELLERIYLNKWADLKVGRVRYGVMCNGDGIIFDDGVGVRLGSDRFYLTATTGNAEAVVQWLEMWRAIWRLNAGVINHTSAVAAMNLAGPQSRAVLQCLTKLDLSPTAFPYMAMREAEVADVRCRIHRIGFVGELGFEIHCSTGHAWHLWEVLYQRGAEMGLQPFGVEAQRILRLEKGHLIIGVDTDALSNPLDAGLEWLIRFDKALFHGREPLLRLRQMEARSRLVGFVMADEDVMPDEGCQVVERGAPVGRVTSVRHSPTLERVLGLAWVPAAHCRLGAHFEIRRNGRDVPATVAALPFYDAEGRRIKS